MPGKLPIPPIPGLWQIPTPRSLFNAATPQDPYPLSPNSWQKRPDNTSKGNGFFGPLIRPDGTSVMSEFSIADSDHPLLQDPTGGQGQDGRYKSYPTLVPTLNRQELEYLLSAPPNSPIPQSIKDKAEAHALARIHMGKSVYADPGEADMNIYPHIKRAGQSPY